MVVGTCKQVLVVAVGTCKRNVLWVVVEICKPELAVVGIYRSRVSWEVAVTYTQELEVVVEICTHKVLLVVVETCKRELGVEVTCKCSVF